MNDVSLAELSALIQRHAGPDTRPLRLMPNIFLGIESAPTLPCQVIVEPVLSLAVQGAKRIEVAKQTFDYRAGQFLVVSVDLPADAYVVEATPDVPYLGFAMTLRPDAIASVLIESIGARMFSDDLPGIGVSAVSGDLVDAIVRLLRLLDRPSDVPVLATGIEREILWRLINSHQGSAVCQIGFADSRMSQIGRAVKWLRHHFAEPVRIDELAAVANMSSTSLHRHFRTVTSMTPIQYQKQLRLQAARTRLLAGRENVSEVSFAVGYDSPSQFSREYRRMFGKPPAKDGEDLRTGASLRSVARKKN